MRDAFGGVFMIRLFLVFIFIYVAFAAVSLNYAKAFRIKNSIISFIEEREITNIEEIKEEDLKELNSILSNAKYSKVCNKGNGSFKADENQTSKGYCYNGIVIKVSEYKQIEGTKSHLIKYEVITYADWNLGAINKLLALTNNEQDLEAYVDGTWSIHGEAKVVVKG